MNADRPALAPAHPLRAAIIDLDGTLVDTLGDFVAVLQHTLADMGCNPIEIARVDRGFVEMTVGKGTEDLLRRSLAHAWGLPDDAAEAVEAVPEAWRHYEPHYLRLNGQHADVFPGVAEGLAQLTALGLPLACLTNKPTAFAEQLLARKGLRAHFAHVFGGDAFARKKPDPLPLVKTCEALGVSPMQTLMVGDSSNDAQAARAAGCEVLLVRYGYNHGHPIEAVPALAHVDRLDQVDWAGLFRP
ncbi:MAG: phosphoglycolate phosphatase [Aquabacterium sp.]|uniref:phosphoglycolate phosphatase n=1 Tax=Aquabacterium sp. TaxID=1872578 RepID=UPI001DDD7679|nr:phosphoglycolate phosphatase [Aquabacterium sp.]MBT9610724.1 phosphoglycolate phosphatase [Aquabacterium sp.]